MTGRTIESMSRVVAYRRAFYDITGCIKAALMLSQAVYWSGTLTAVRREGWFYKSSQEWQFELGISKREQMGARKKMVAAGVLEEELRGRPARLWFRVNFAKLQELLEKLDTPVPNSTTDEFGGSEWDDNGDETDPKLCGNRTTTKTTTETTPDTSPEFAVVQETARTARTREAEPVPPAPVETIVKRVEEVEDLDEPFIGALVARAKANGWRQPTVSIYDRLQFRQFLALWGAEKALFGAIAASLSQGIVEKPGPLCGDGGRILRAALDEARAAAVQAAGVEREKAAGWSGAERKARVLRVLRESPDLAGDIGAIAGQAGLTLEEAEAVADADSEVGHRMKTRRVSSERRRAIMAERLPWLNKQDESEAE